MGKEPLIKCDMIVGIPSYNEADTIGFVVKTVDEGLRKHFPSKKAIIINVDNASPDNTKDVFLEVETSTEKKYISTPEGILGKGNNFLNLFKFASTTTAKTFIVVDADLKSITPDWMDYLGTPIIKGEDYVTPLYTRHQFDGSITNHICYPAIFGLLSTNIRQPIGGDFAFSRKLMDYWRAQPMNDTVKHYGIDIFMTMHAILGGFNICQSGLGVKVHKASAPKLGPMFEQVIQTLLTVLSENKDNWLKTITQPVREIPKFGLTAIEEPQELTFNMHAMKESCKRAYAESREITEELLPAYSFAVIDDMFKMDFYGMDMLLWSQIFYNLLYKFDQAKDDATRMKVIKVLTPLYFARTLSFNYNTWKYNIKYAEEEVQRQALGFASQRHYLLGLYGEELICGCDSE